MKNSILEKNANRKGSLTLEEYKKLKDGLKKTLVSKSSFYNITKGCFVLGLPLLAVNTGQAQCQTLSITNSNIPDDGGFANGLGVDVDGDAMNDFIFYETPNGTGKARRVTGGTMSIVTTGGAYAFRSAINFNSMDPIPGGNGADYRAYWDYGGGGNWPVESGGASATGFMGIKKGTDYGFLEFTVQRVGSSYVASFPSGGAPETNSGGGATAGDCASLLPVEFTSFITQTKGNDVTLIWKTSSETDNAGFQLQRSENGRDFKEIHWEDGQGTSTQITTYEHTDEDLQSGKTYYYRLNQIDFDGRSDLSPIVSVLIKGETSEAGEFYPNPAESGEVSIDISSFEASEWIADVYDVKGVFINNQIYQLAEGNNQVTVKTETLSAGTYFVKFENGKERFYKTLIIR